MFETLERILKCNSIFKPCEHDDFGNGLWPDELRFLFHTTSESGILLCVNQLTTLNQT